MTAPDMPAGRPAEDGLPKWSLRMTFSGPFGESFTMAIGIEPAKQRLRDGK